MPNGRVSRHAIFSTIVSPVNLEVAAIGIFIVLIDFVKLLEL